MLHVIVAHVEEREEEEEEGAGARARGGGGTREGSINKNSSLTTV
jgi:hypothetical protein